MRTEKEIRSVAADLAKIIEMPCDKPHDLVHCLLWTAQRQRNTEMLDILKWVLCQDSHIDDAAIELLAKMVRV